MTALILSDLLYMTAVGMTMVSLFLKSRLPRRKTVLIVFGTTLALMAAEVVLTYAFSVHLGVRLYGLIVHLPSLLVTAALSQYRGWRLLFQILSAILFSAMIQQAAGIVYYCSGQQAWTLWPTFLLITPAVLWLLHSRICPIVFQVLDELRLNIPVCGMVKDDHHRTRGLYYNNEELPIDRSSEAFRLITRIQDEAHRFAIEYHRQLRGKGQVHSILDDIEGIGPARRKALMRHYLSLDAIREASVEELAQIPSMNEKAAESVYKFLH